MPEYPGGEQALMNDLMGSIKYPDEAKKNGIQGKVFVSFVVDEHGKVTNAKIERGVNPALDAESLRVVNGLKIWKPGKEKGKAVKVAYTIPINYALDGKPDKK
jgi:TonB family protein